METIKVNMNPNPLDVQAIHASQNDGEARQWEFELHNNGELVDTSDVKEQLVFKAYKGGTEQLLPENTSAPTTTPILADIQYPDGLRTDQYFTYRETPTTISNKARIKTIKGKTLKWNQLVSSASGWASNNGTLSQSGNTYTYTVTALGNSDYENRMQRAFPFVIPKGHKILVSCEFYYPRNTQVAIWLIRYSGLSNRAIRGSALANQWTNISGIIEEASTEFGYYQLALNTIASTGFSVGDSVQVRNPMAIDLTMLFGEGNEPSTVEEFTSLFSLPYYAYNQGSLLSFNGNGIKTVGFNQWDEEWEMGAYNSADGSKADNVRDRIRNKNPICIFPSVNYYKNKGLQVYYYDANMNYIGWNNLANQGIFTPPSNACYMNFNGSANSGTTYNNDICINISDPSKNGIYEPYVESTLSLPISTYFPTGMKSAGSAYDELTESKAITRIGSVDLGSLTWTRTMQGGYGRFNAFIESGYSSKPLGAFTNVKCVLYTVETSLGPVGNNSTNMAMCGFVASNGGLSLCIRNDSYTDATSFTSAMNGVYLYYELATPTETSFTTASLVTENAEIPLSNEDGVLIGKCTEQLSENPGFIDAKIKLADADGECYSNKIQLHVERSPQ